MKYKPKTGMCLAGILLLILSAGWNVAEGFDQQKEISKLIDQLALDPNDNKGWRKSAEMLAKYGKKALIPLTEAVRTNRVSPGWARYVFRKLPDAVVIKEVPVYLADNDIRICELAAEALAEHGDASAVPALTDALRRCRKARTDGKAEPPDDKINSMEWHIALALWKLGEKQKAAKEILELARVCEPDHKYELIEIIDGDTARQFMTEKERLDFLIHYKIKIKTLRPMAFDVVLSSSKQQDQLLPEEDLQLLKKYRKKVLPVMRERLHNEETSAGAALTLGYLKDAESLPILRRLLIHSPDGYGWETDFPDALAYHEYPSYHSYEEAIRHISGKSLEEIITLTPGEIQSLLQRYHSGDTSALYILFRFHPDMAEQEISHKFKNTEKKEWRVGLCTMLAQHFLQTGFSKEKVEELLGKPDMVDTVPVNKSQPQSQPNRTRLGEPLVFSENKWGYVCENLQNHSWKRGILLTFDNDKIADIQLTRDILQFFIKKEND